MCYVHVMLDKINRFLATGLGLGYMPVAPGTFGSLLGAVLFYFLRDQPKTWFIEFALVFALISIVIAHLAEKSFKQKDCQKIVIDEVAGILFCYAFVSYNMYNLVLGFILFRLFDIAKIFPANHAQNKLVGGLGVVGDDLVAGIQGGIILYYLPQLIQWVENLILFSKQLV